jgi:allophanate hydrolase subunit 1
MESPERNYGIIRWASGGYQIVGKLSLEVFKANPKAFFCTLVAGDLTQEEADALFKLLPQDE